MPGQFSLEKLLDTESKAPHCHGCSFMPNYEAMKRYLAQAYYPWIQANCPWFTDHGERHVASVIQTANHLLSKNENDMTCLDAYLLLTSIIWHDVGMVTSRASHAKEAQTFIEKVRELCFPDSAIFRIVTQIVRAHSGHDGWSMLLPSEVVTPCPHETFTVYPQCLAAVLRFADEVSETRTRITPTLIPNVPAQNRIYWEYANTITGSKPEPEPTRRRLLLAIELQREAAIRRFQCPKEVVSRANSSGEISLIEYVVCRIEKMNNERAYCFPYLTRYADIITIEVRIQICDGPDPLVSDEIILGDCGLSSSRYPTIKLFDSFFEMYPQLHPDTLKGGA